MKVDCSLKDRSKVLFFKNNVWKLVSVSSLTSDDAKNAVCPECKKEVELHVNTKRKDHFAHFVDKKRRSM